MIVVIKAHLTSWSGYGLLAQHLGQAIECQGHAVHYVPISIDEHFGPLDPFVRDRLAPKARPTLTITNPPAASSGTERSDVLFTMWETTRLPLGSAEAINAYPCVVVPCHANAHWFQDSGVTAPVVVAPLGIEPTQFRPLPEGPTVFGAAGRMAHGGNRKGLSEVMHAFVRAFPSTPDVRLEVKCWPDCLNRLDVPDDSRIRIVTDCWTREELSGWYDRITCYVTASKGEGWGLHTLEAMTHGRPVIATRWSGTAEFFDYRFGWELEYDLALATGLYAGSGEWAVPREASLVEALRACHQDRTLAQTKGTEAGSWANGFTWSRTAEVVLSALAIAEIRNRERWPGGLTDHEAMNVETKLALANTCSHLSRRNWIAICKAGRGGISPHFAVPADLCSACVERGGHQ